ncbi:MAG: cadherin-like beta sandwich domain-containing protein [Clostridiales bacterium]|nr:cadherin-like beta sandwich domain-containing protein [Clostridiales bacterium]
MKNRRIKAGFLAVVMIAVSMWWGAVGAAAIVTCETQFDYDSANMSWLKDLIVKEDMTTVSGLSKSTVYTARANYPYDETSESFSTEIAYYQVLYTLDSDMANAAYLYMLELAESFASAVVSGYSDEFIQSYLESYGIVYPDDDSSETRIVARAFFAVITSDDDYVITRGTGLYDAFTAYISTMLGVSSSSILKFDSDADFSDLEQYVIAACKYALYQAGYNVDASTSDEEVYRLLAIMTIRAQGISIDSGTATFEEVKNKYLCAMMCKIYGVSVDYNSFVTALDNNNLDYYMLQLIGKEGGIAVADNLDLDDAFLLVAEETGYFDLEEGEFYADISEYDLTLDYLRSNIWIYPQTVAVDADGVDVSVTINGNAATENYYNQVSLDTSKSTETVTIVVTYTDDSGSTTSTYLLHVTQGTETASTETTISEALLGVMDTVESVLTELGLDSSIAEIVVNIPFELPQRVLSITSLLLPSFDVSSLGSDFITALFGYSEDDDSNIDSGTIGGVGGLDTYMSSSDTSSLSLNFDTSNLTVSTVASANTAAETTTTQANSLVIAEQTTVQTVSGNVTTDSGNWFTELMSDTQTVAILMIVLVATFVVCLVLFLNIIKMKNKRGTGKASDDGAKKKKMKAKR